MHIIKSLLFQKFPEIIFGISTKYNSESKPPYYFNMSVTVGDDLNHVDKNREAFFNAIGLTTSQIAFQKQIHSDIIRLVDKSGLHSESDAMITTKKGIGLALSTADCTPVFIYDKKNQLIAAIHSGWRGTQKKILLKTLMKLAKEYNSKPEDLYVYVGPSISQKNYEVGKEVAELFEKKYVIEKENHYYLNIVAGNIDQLSNFCVPEKQIEISDLCTYEEKNLLHSYRRDGELSGRALGVISIKG